MNVSSQSAAGEDCPLKLENQKLSGFDPSGFGLRR